MSLSQGCSAMKFQCLKRRANPPPPKDEGELRLLSDAQRQVVPYREYAEKDQDDTRKWF